MTNEELGVHIKYISEYIEKQEERDIPTRVQDLEFWRKAIIWGAGVVLTSSVFISTTIYNMMVNDISDRMEIVMDSKIRTAFDDLVLEEIE